MRDLYVFFDEEDAKILIDWFNQEEEIAYIIADGINRCRAVPTVERLEDGKQNFWYVPNGTLTVRENGSDKIVADPWSGWTGSLRNIETFYLLLYTKPEPAYFEIDEHSAYDARDTVGGNEFLRVSNFRWVGNYSPRLKKWVKREAIILQNRKYDTIVWAFPSAFQKLKNGMKYESWGGSYNSLSRALKEANLPKKHIEAQVDETPKPLPTDVVLGGDAKPLPTDVVLSSKHRKRQYF